MYMIFGFMNFYFFFTLLNFQSNTKLVVFLSDENQRVKKKNTNSSLIKYMRTSATAQATSITAFAKL